MYVSRENTLDCCFTCRSGDFASLFYCNKQRRLVMATGLCEFYIRRREGEGFIRSNLEIDNSSESV